eukprot:TRINITY_DN69523_c0_g1_i1.p1 TRINITY_DN69523_c0_g1~~TRINITY_DN69523_c0_g1_i1.p1  ORF type:complete len:371 (+),score=33.17 TRINITY_DN69523_c0_g1_i1:213-1325(+)
MLRLYHRAHYITCWLLFALSIFQRCSALPAGLQFEMAQLDRFEEWDDSDLFQDVNAVADDCHKGVEATSAHCSARYGASDNPTVVASKMDGVRNYYNSERAISLIASSKTLPEGEFHSPFKVAGLTEKQHMMKLAGIWETKQSATVLDYGCGLGVFARELAADGCCATHCVNIAEAQVEAAAALTPEDVQVDYRVYDGHTFPYANETFEVIFFLESYSFHTPNQCEIAREFARTLKPGGHLVGLDWMAAPGLTDAEYAYWVGPINLAWEATTGTPEGIARCFRGAGLTHVEIMDTAYYAGIDKKRRPRNQFLPRKEDKAEMRRKYQTLAAQLSIESFQERHRHSYALEAMSLAIENHMYLEAFITARKPL